MNTYIEKTARWVNQLKQREKIILIVLGCAVIYMLFNFLLLRPLQKKEALLLLEKDKLTNQIKVLDESMQAINDIVTSETFGQKIREEQKLSGASKTAQHNLLMTLAKIIPNEKLADLEKVIVTEKQDVDIIDLKKLPEERANEIEAALPLRDIVIFKNPLELHFKSNYFSTLMYLNSLEQLPWFIYWDSLNYKVTQYPNADVAVTFYVLSKQGSPA